MELREVVVYTRDMERAIAFYRDVLGLEPDVESSHWTTFRTGACTFATRGQNPRIPPSRSPTLPPSASGSSQRASR